MKKHEMLKDILMKFHHLKPRENMNIQIRTLDHQLALIAFQNCYDRFVHIQQLDNITLKLTKV